MRNVIRPHFGSKRNDEPSRDDGQVIEALCIYGEEAGYRVGLVQDDGEPEGPVLQVFVGRLDSTNVEAVAILPTTPEGRVDADAIGLAILRTLEIVARDKEDTGAS